jgi:hypothetical protein
VTLSVESLGETPFDLGSVVCWNLCGRPAYVIAHMSNSPGLIERDLAAGANAIECDVGPRDGSADGPLTAFHRFAPPYVRRTLPRTPLAELGAAIHGSLDRLALVMLDCHVLRDAPEDYRVFGRRLAETIRPFLPEQRAVMSIPEPAMAGLFDGVRDAGYGAGRDLCLDGENPKRGSQRRWIEGAERLSATMTGVGTDCFVPWDLLTGWFGPVAAAVTARDRGGSVAKVYSWTLSTKAAMRQMLDLAVDGLVVNDPAAMRQVLSEEPYSWLYRPAEGADSQFAVHGAQAESAG